MASPLPYPAYLRVLTRRQRLVVVLRIEGWTWDDIARHLGVSTRTVRTHWERAVRRLRAELQASQR